MTESIAPPPTCTRPAWASWQTEALGGIRWVRGRHTMAVTEAPDPDAPGARVRWGRVPAPTPSARPRSPRLLEFGMSNVNKPTLLNARVAGRLVGNLGAGSGAGRPASWFW